MPDVVGGSPVSTFAPTVSGGDLDVWTYQDAVDFVCDAFQIPAANTTQLRSAQRAVDNALIRLGNQADWSYYSRRAFLRTQDSVSDGTIAYTHSTLRVTLTGATWPSWALYGRIQINGSTYDVASVVSSTVITLGANGNPGADIAAGTPYLMWQDEYTLPDDFARVGILLDQASLYPLQYVPPDEAESIAVSYKTAGYPEWYTVRRSSHYNGRRVLVLAPGPTSGRMYEFSYGARALPIRIKEFSSRTCTTDGSTLVTFESATVLPQNLEGAVLRISDDGQLLPTSKFGRLDEAGNTLFRLPYAQAYIVERNSDTTCTVDSAIAALTDVRFTISDPIDIDIPTMQDAFLGLVEAEYARFTYREPDQRYGRIREALARIREGMQADYASRSPSVASGGFYRTMRLQDFLHMFFTN